MWPRASSQPGHTFAVRACTPRQTRKCRTLRCSPWLPATTERLLSPNACPWPDNEAQEFYGLLHEEIKNADVLIVDAETDDVLEIEDCYLYKVSSYLFGCKRKTS